MPFSKCFSVLCFAALGVKFKGKGQGHLLGANFSDCAESDHLFVQKRLLLVTFGAPAEGNTRLLEWWNLLISHAPPAIVLPVGKCSHILYLPYKLAPYAVRSTVGVGCAIEDVGSCLVLPHKLCPKKLLSPAAVHTPHTPEQLIPSLELLRRAIPD